jgi:hypothetical protein
MLPVAVIAAQGAKIVVAQSLEAGFGIDLGGRKIYASPTTPMSISWGRSWASIRRAVAQDGFKAYPSDPRHRDPRDRADAPGLDRQQNERPRPES